MYPRTLHRFAEVRFRGTSTTKDEIAPSICFSFQRTNIIRIPFVRSHVGLERKLLKQNITPLHISFIVPTPGRLINKNIRKCWKQIDKTKQTFFRVNSFEHSNWFEVRTPYTSIYSAYRLKESSQSIKFVRDTFFTVSHTFLQCRFFNILSIREMCDCQLTCVSTDEKAKWAMYAIQCMWG